MALSRLEYLFNRHIDRTISAPEREELSSLIQDAGNDDELRMLIDRVIADPVAEVPMPEESARAILATILGEPVEVGEPERGEESGAVLPLRRRWGMWAAAVVLLVAGGAVWFGMHKSHPASVAVTSAPALVRDILPGGDKATLTLGDGSVIVLDSARNGELSQQGSAKVSKTNKGQLAYKALTGEAAPVVYNTVSTPLRGQYQVVLPDGTKVWLNSLSSLRFPTAFTGGRREVEVTGEAYFEVAKDKRSPFVVSLLSTASRKLKERVEVLGTAFNVMDYDDEPALRTTLVEGAVRVEADGGSKKLAAGQQTQLDSLGRLGLVTGANVDKAVAWRYGNFQFDGDDIVEVMRQLTRWYGVEVMYEARPQVHYTGGVSRNLNISKVLNMLALSGLHCRIDGNTVVVMP
jgi:ferric-dicitrate binding protein FerR (iron transport regulator)